MSTTDTRDVTLVSRWEHDGVTHQGGDTVTVPAPLARDLILIGKARPADQDTSAAPEPTETPALAADATATNRDTDTPGDAPAPAEQPEAPADGDTDKAPVSRRAARK